MNIAADIGVHAFRRSWSLGGSCAPPRDVSGRGFVVVMGLPTEASVSNHVGSVDQVIDLPE